MKPSINHRPAQMKKEKERSKVTKYMISFFLMIAFTALSFYLVAVPLFDANTTFWVIMIAALIQAILQLFAFMHLDQKGYGPVIVMMIFAVVIAGVSAVGIVLM
jgi:cytochrome c oxidase subunit 4